MRRITFLFFVLYCIIACTESNEFLPQNVEVVGTIIPLLFS